MVDPSVGCPHGSNVEVVEICRDAAAWEGYTGYMVKLH